MATRDYRLKVRSMRKFTKDENGDRRARTYREGDKITLDTADADRLLRANALEEWTDTEEGTSAGTGDAPVAPGALSGQTADPLLTEAQKGAVQEDPDADTGDGDDADADEDAEPEDGYDDLDYQELQKTAKDRGLNAGGSKEDLIARLRESDNQ